MLSRWQIKALVQKTISFLPGSRRINYFFQKHVTRGVLLSDEHFSLKLRHAIDHQEFYSSSPAHSGKGIILELGTGWYPVVPTVFYLCNAPEIISVDLNSWMTDKTILDTFRMFASWEERGKLGKLSERIDPGRWEQMMETIRNPQLFSSGRLRTFMNFRPLVGDASQLDLEDASVDFICSNNTFEHIPAPVLEKILSEFMRVLKPGGRMSHFIDMSDHFAHFDPRITIYNFLRFSKKRWNLLDNSIQPQNRLRFRDYLEMYRDLHIPVSQQIIEEGSRDQLAEVKLHRDFADYSPRELAISHATIITETDP